MVRKEVEEWREGMKMVTMMSVRVTRERVSSSQSSSFQRWSFVVIVFQGGNFSFKCSQRNDRIPGLKFPGLKFAGLKFAGLESFLEDFERMESCDSILD